ncbi:MAG: DUF3568 family protein [Methylophilaceae bacterium]
MYKFFRVAILSIAVCVLSGCVAAATTVAGMGGSAAINHTITGVSYRTFTAPAKRVEKATIIALRRMKIKVVSKGKKKNDDIYVITAKTSKRKIEVEIEPISENATRISVKAKKSVFTYDSATADEIVQQTKRQLG